MPLQSANLPELHTLENFKGLNQQGRRASIGDDEEWWNENMFAIGPGNLRSCWGHGAAIWTAPTTIRRMFFGFIGDVTPQFGAPPPGRYGWMFCDDEHVYQIDLDTHGVTDLGACWEPVAPQYWASAKVWRPKFFGSVAGQGGGVLIGSPLGLFAWDGSTLTHPGDPAPDWLTDIQETDPSGPIPPMPQGLPGIYSMEVYSSRLWVAGKDVVSFSAPSNGADFSTTSGGGSFGYFGDSLTYSYMDLCQSAGYLYLFGDSSTDMVSNVQLTGSGTPEDPYTTNFNYQNIDPQVGHRFPRPVGRIGRYLTLYNGAGIYLMQGGDAENIGEKTTNTYVTLDTSLYLPTMAPATIFGFKVMLCNGRFTDPFGVTRNLLLMWHPVQGQPFWSVASQNLELTSIGAYEQDSIITPYGTDGTNLYQLFAQPDNALIKRFSSKFIAGGGNAKLSVKNYKRVYAELHDNSGQGVDITGTLTARGGGVPGGVEDIGFSLTAGQLHDIIGHGVSGAGIQCAVDLQSKSPDFTLERLHVAADERTLYGA
jgi:hypothetical protein